MFFTKPSHILLQFCRPLIRPVFVKTTLLIQKINRIIVVAYWITDAATEVTQAQIFVNQHERKMKMINATETIKS